MLPYFGKILMGEQKLKMYNFTCIFMGKDTTILKTPFIINFMVSFIFLFAIRPGIEKTVHLFRRCHPKNDRNPCIERLGRKFIQSQFDKLKLVDPDKIPNDSAKNL